MSSQTVRLKRILGRRKEAKALLEELLQGMDMSVTVTASDGTILLGAEQEQQPRHPITADGDTLGYVSGAGQASLVATLLSFLAKKEAEQKRLGSEVLDRYRELNLLYNLSEKLSSSLALTAVCQTALEEATRLIVASGGAVWLASENDPSELTLVATKGQALPWDSSDLGQGVIGSVVATGKGEIVNDLTTDPRTQAFAQETNSLVCAPLRAKNRTSGAMALANVEPIVYTAGDLKLLNTVAAQAGPAVDNALIYERTVREAREREARLQRQIRELQIELDEAKQEQQVAEITESDYFQELRSQADSLRNILGGTDEQESS